MHESTFWILIGIAYIILMIYVAYKKALKEKTIRINKQNQELYRILHNSNKHADMIIKMHEEVKLKSNGGKND